MSRRSPWVRALSSASAALLYWSAACAEGQPGDSCSNDAQCASGSCFVGECNYRLLSLLAPHDADRPDSSPPARVVCEDRQASVCEATLGCELTTLCLAPNGLDHVDEASKVSHCAPSSTCESPCTRAASCRRSKG